MRTNYAIAKRVLIKGGQTFGQGCYILDNKPNLKWVRPAQEVIMLTTNQI